MTLVGKVLSVETRNLSEPVVADAAIAATTLYVADASTFDENGGLVTVNGEQLAYSAIDVDTNTLALSAGLAAAVTEQTDVEVYPATPVKTALVDIGDVGGDPITATVPHNLLDRLADGTRDDGSAETVTLEQRGYELVIADAVAEPLVTQSLDYVEGEEGWGQSDAVVQMQDAQVTGELGAATLSGDVIKLAGTSLEDRINPLPLGIIRMVTRGGTGLTTKNAGDTSSNTELRLFTIQLGQLYAGRLYRIVSHGYVQATVAAGATDVYDIRFRYTTDGVTLPTTSSDVFDGGTKRVPLPSGSTSISNDFNVTVEFSPPADAVYIVAVTLARAVGAGVGRIVTSDYPRQFSFAVEDCGLSATAAAPDALQQTAYSDGSGSDNPPETTKTLMWQPTHTENFLGLSFLGGSGNGADEGVARIGWDAAEFGPPTSTDRPDFSVLHFNYADIVSKLAPATSIISVQLKFTVKTRESAAGLDMSVFAHKYTSYPWTMALDYPGEVAAGRIVVGQGARNDCAPGSTYTITLNTAVGTNLRSGTYKGIGLTTTTYTAAGLGTIYGNPHAARPTLIITFKSP